MKIAIVGAGFTGLSASYYLSQKDVSVTVFEQAPYLGGLAAGINEVLPGSSHEWDWDWDLEQFYHHWFTNDTNVFELAKAIGTDNKIIIKRPQTDVLYNDQTYQLDSPISLLLFPHIPLIERIKTGFLLAQLKYFYNQDRSRKFENVSAWEYLKKYSGEKAYKIIWEPLLIGKFGKYYQEISMRWFWARIHKRTPRLAYYEGGFSAFLHDIAQSITSNQGVVKTQTPVTSITHQPNANNLIVTYIEKEQTQTDVFDQVIVTTPPQTLLQLVPELPNDYKDKLSRQRGIGALVLTLALHHSVLDKTYWLNINDTSWPFLALVEHTNFIDKQRYNDEHIVYIGAYCDPMDERMQMSKEQLIEKFTPFIKRICPLFCDQSIIRSYLYKTNYAQPIVGLNYEQNILPLKTPIKNLYLASMAQVYPWDRGTNYAIEMGKTVSELITK